MAPTISCKKCCPEKLLHGEEEGGGGGGGGSRAAQDHGAAIEAQTRYSALSIFATGCSYPAYARI